MTNGCEELALLAVVDFLKLAACFLACSSASLRDNAIAAFKSASSSSSLIVPLGLGVDVSFLTCDCGT